LSEIKIVLDDVHMPPKCDARLTGFRVNGKGAINKHGYLPTAAPVYAFTSGELFHSTPETNVEAILREGLKPGKAEAVCLYDDPNPGFVVWAHFQYDPMPKSVRMATFAVDVSGLTMEEGYDGEGSYEFVGPIEPARVRLIGVEETSNPNVDGTTIPLTDVVDEHGLTGYGQILLNGLKAEADGKAYGEDEPT
jgi:hypothetical protein